MRIENMAKLSTC